MSRLNKFRKTLAALSRITTMAAFLQTKTPRASLKLKRPLSNLLEGFQQTIAEKVVGEEANWQNR